MTETDIEGQRGASARQMAPPDRGIIRGTLLAESLRPGTWLAGYDLRILRLSRHEVTGVAEYQPAVWAAIDFEAPAIAAAPLAADLAGALLARLVRELEQRHRGHGDSRLRVQPVQREDRVPRSFPAGSSAIRAVTLPHARPRSSTAGTAESRKVSWTGLTERWLGAEPRTGDSFRRAAPSRPRVTVGGRRTLSS